MAEYYFSYDNGNDSNPGTEAEPKKTIAELESLDLYPILLMILKE